MKIKAGCDVSTYDFYYDLTSGGYLFPEEILEEEQDIARVRSAINTLKEFEAACEEQIPGFFQ